MATTAGSTFPFRPIGGPGGSRTSAHKVAPLDPSITIQSGDVLVIATATNDVEVDNVNPGAATDIYGIFDIGPKATEPTAAATIDRDLSPGPDVDDVWHSANVILALPGQRFAGNMAETVTPNDHTGVYADDVNIDAAIRESTEGYAILTENPGADTVCARTMDYVNPQVDTANADNIFSFGREAGVGLTNPRMEFYFLVASTCFG